MDVNPSKQPAAAARAERAYLESRVMGAEPLELLVMLYEGLLKNVLAGQRALRERNWEAAQAALSKARSIVAYLTQSLRPEGGEISARLRSLYAFCFEAIGRANLTQDAELLDEVLPVLQELSGAWHELLRRPEAAAPGGKEL